MHLVTWLRENGIEVSCGLMEEQARALNPGFVKRMQRRLPYVSLKMAASLDGRSALNNGVSQWITAEPARRDVQMQRAAASAIVTSAVTLLRDNARMNLRLQAVDLGQRCELRQPIRVILDSQLRLSGGEKIFATRGDIWIYTCNPDRDKQQQLTAAGAEVIQLPADEHGRLPLRLLFEDLAVREINEVHTECGASLAGALIESGLVDRIVLLAKSRMIGNIIDDKYYKDKRFRCGFLILYSTAPAVR